MNLSAFLPQSFSPALPGLSVYFFSAEAGAYNHVCAKK
ncbi:hypothetical protein LEMLEM_LOCUS8277 [Lemmus lemmus]